MSEGVNRVFLFGNLGAEPELRFTQGGSGVLNLRLATTESYLDAKQERQERTEWHSVVIFGKRAEALAKFLRKGSSVLVEGRLQTSKYETREGQKREKTEIVATNIVVAGGRGDGPREQREERRAPSGGGGGAGAQMPDEDIPF